MSKFRHTVTLLRAPVVTSTYGNQGRDWSLATETPSPASVQWANSSEDVSGENRVTTRMKLYLPHGTDLDPTDRVRYGGEVYRVDGDVETWAPRHVKALLLKVTQEVG